MAVAVQPAVIVLVARYHAATDATVVGQRGREVSHVALFVPAAILGGDVAGKLTAVGVLAHHVNGGGGVTGAGGQAVGAANHFNTFIQGGIGEGVTHIPAGLKQGRNTVDHKVIDLKTAGVEVGALRVRCALGNAGGVFQHVAEGLQLLILHALFADDAHGLRDITRNQQHFGAGGGGFNAVVLALFIGIAAGGGTINDNGIAAGGVRRGGKSRGRRKGKGNADGQQ